MPTLPTLYRSERQWRIWVDKRGKKVFLCTEYGTIGGKLVKTDREITECGREDSLIAKANQQAKKKWEDKKKRENYTDGDEEPTSKKIKVDEAVLPMLADKVTVKGDGLKNMPLPCHSQPKLDGFRCVTHVHKNKMTSRTNKEFLGLAGLRKVLCDTLKKRLSKTKGFGSGDLYLDGELFVNGDDFNKLSSIIKPAQHHDDYDPPEIEYHVYDCFDLSHMDTPFCDRIKFIQTNLNNLSDRIFCVPTGIVNDIDHMHREMQLCLGMGHEGLMLRNSTSPYVLRKRSKHLQKFKEFHDAEFRIVNYKEGKGTDVGTIIFECEVDGSVFSVRPKGTVEFRKKLFQDGDSYIGQMLTVTYQELSEKGVPRFPVGKVIRPDFDYNH